ncbi:hypothetical protein KCU99_g7222, partial [Aureobasidium melanogenum]
MSHLRALRTLKGSLAERPLTEESHNQAAPISLEQPGNDTTQDLTTNLLSEAELANLAMDNFGNIEWGWDPYENDPFGADLSMQPYLNF